MRTNAVYRARMQFAPIWPHRRGLRSPAVHGVLRYRDAEAGVARAGERTAQGMAPVVKQAA